jgi:C-terminal processing protease CtpA/Prc
LIGSKFFANEELSESFENNTSSPICAYLNMDMIGRYKDKLTIHGVGSSNIWRRVIQEANVPVGLNLNLQNDSHVPTDSTSFYSKGVPIISGFTGLHNDYHSPTDTTEKINYEKLTDTTKLFSRIIEILAQSEGSINYIADSSPRKTSMGKLRSYLGTIPDYSNTDVKGVMLSGVSRKGPADLAGIRSKDVIVSLAGKKIETIYDYTDAISICEPNVETIIKVMRNGKVTALKIIPKSR